MLSAHIPSTARAFKLLVHGSSSPERTAKLRATEMPPIRSRSSHGVLTVIRPTHAPRLSSHLFRSSTRCLLAENLFASALPFPLSWALRSHNSPSSLLVNPSPACIAGRPFAVWKHFSEEISPPGYYHFSFDASVLVAIRDRHKDAVVHTQTTVRQASLRQARAGAMKDRHAYCNSDSPVL